MQLELFQLQQPATPIKPPLKWAGGKTSLIDRLSEIYSNHRDRTWVDLFAGSCALPLAIQPESVVINDANPDLISFWKWVQNDGVINNFEFKNEREYYLEMRSRFNKTREPELFYYLNRNCFNGLCRYNSSGDFNVNIGSYKSINYQYDFTNYQPDARYDKFINYQSVIDEWKIINQSFQSVPLFPGDFVYADPPYDDGFVNYCGSFTWDDQVLLAKELAESGAAVVASNKGTPRIVELYNSLGFDIEIIMMGRNISSNGDRAKVAEILATKNI